MSLSIIKKLVIAFSIMVFLFYFGCASESASKDCPKRPEKSLSLQAQKKK